MICFPLWMQITVNGDKDKNPNAISPLEIRLENQEAIFFCSKDNLKELS